MGFQYLNSEDYIQLVSSGGITRERYKTTFTDVNRDSATYTYKDFGIGYFKDFEINFDFKCTSFNSVAIGLIALSIDQHTLQSMQNYGDGILIYATNYADKFVIQDYDIGGNPSVATENPLVLNTLHFLTFKRIGTTYTLEVYNNSSRSNNSLVEKVTLAGATDKYRYLNVGYTYDNDGDSDTSSWYIENVNIIEDANKVNNSALIDSRSNYGDATYISTLPYTSGCKGPSLMRTQTRNY